MDLTAERLVPALDWLRTYHRDWVRADVLAGIAAGMVVVPQAMAYATIADLPVQVGLYTCMVPMAVYALVGGSRILSVSTTSTIATLTASTLVASVCWTVRSHMDREKVQCHESCPDQLR